MLRKLIASNIIQEYTREQFCKKWWVKLLQMRKEDSNEAFSLSLETWKLIRFVFQDFWRKQTHSINWDIIYLVRWKIRYKEINIEICYWTGTFVLLIARKTDFCICMENSS